VHVKLTLLSCRYVTKKAYVLAPETGSNLAVHRDTGVLELTGKLPQLPWQSNQSLIFMVVLLETIPPASEQESTLNVYGLLGFIKLFAGKLLYQSLFYKCFAVLTLY